jgi:hypothetical protein
VKVYQEKWYQRLLKAEKANNIKPVYAVCLKIVKDDTGGTDLIASLLAKIIIKMLRSERDQ